MTLTPEQFNIAFGVIIALIVALTGYLNNQSSKKRTAETQDQITEVKAKVDDVHAAVTGSQPTPTEPNPFLKDGHELPPFQKPPRPPLP